MNSKRIVFALAASVVIAAGFTFLLSRFLKARTATPTLQYLVLKKPMDVGSVLQPDDVQKKSWPAAMPLEGAVTTPDSVSGRSLLYPVAAGEPLLNTQLSEPGSGAGLSWNIPHGMRALALKTDQVVGVAGYMLPGTHVDVLVTYHAANAVSPTTTIVLQDAKILTAGQKMQPDPQGKPSPVDVVTILVSPEDAERVVLATTQGSVHFVLRNGEDHEQSAARPMQISALGAPDATPKAVVSKAAAPAQPKKYSIEVLRGDKQSVETF